MSIVPRLRNPELVTEKVNMQQWRYFIDISRNGTSTYLHMFGFLSEELELEAFLIFDR